jgi:perosamine synthetase
MKKKLEFKKHILLGLKKIIKNKTGRLHDPLFIGNEKKYLNECISSGFVSSVGKYVKIFENKIASYTKVKYAVATNSGISALHLILKYFNLNQNDEVIMPSYTYVATANAVMYCGSTPNFVDVETETLGVCPVKLSLYLQKISEKKGKNYYNKKTGKRIRALIAVHVYGFPGKIVEIKKICRKYNMLFIEDAAETIGSFLNGKHLGTFSDAGMISFNGNKTLTCGGGGVVLTNNKKMAFNLKHLSTQAKIPNNNDHVHDEIGYNYRMTNLSAAVACAQLEKIKEIITAKRKNFQLYKKTFKNSKYIDFIQEPKNSKCNYWLITGILKNKESKEKLIIFLKKNGFYLRLTWRPLHTLKIFNHCPKDNMSNSMKLFNTTINFPSSPAISYNRTKNEN